jgi:hypothetical protein
MIQSHSARHPSSVPRWLTICLQWLLFQQMHYHGSESRGLADRSREIEVRPVARFKQHPRHSLQAALQGPRQDDRRGHDNKGHLQTWCY